jgi:hypothetical protein
MNNKICLLFALCVLTLSITIKHEQVLAGGWTSINVNSLNAGDK